ncbi:hypothetical protein C8J56DRAFT_1161816 [Mycena floridula]|nr:hypothetical protein C8J56DRAFT_1161816 [Mycena floridula]
MSSSRSSRSSSSDSFITESDNRSSISEAPVTSRTCHWNRFPLAFIQRVAQYEDELRATECLSDLFSVAKAFVDPSPGAATRLVQRSRTFHEQMNKYFIAASGAERSQPLADALNTILDIFRDHEFDSLPTSNDLLFSAHALGVAGIHSDALERLPDQEISGISILNFWEIIFSRQAMITRPEPSRSRSCPPSSRTFPSSHCSSQKHRLENATSSSDSPRKKRKLSVVPSELTAQSASYAKKRLVAEPLMSHALGLILEDEQLSLWWHDRESIVQSLPIDMTSELAHVVVLVILFQRFSETDWIVWLVFRGSRRHDFLQGRQPLLFSEHLSRRSQFKRQFGFLRFAIRRRVQALHQGFLLVRDTSLKTEAAMIAKCYDLADGDRMILDHLPSVVVAQDFPNSSTSKMRNLFGIPSDKPTMLQILIFDWLDPITNLKGEEFWVAFWNILRCHFLLWQRNTAQRYQRQQLAPLSLSRRRATGTISFMALELLDIPGREGEIPHLYRHDLESFAWVLLWICVRFHDGEEHSGPLDRFLTDDHELCYCAKRPLGLPATLEPTPDYKSCFLPAVVMVFHWVKFESDARARRDHLFILAHAPDGGQTTATLAEQDDSVEEDEIQHLKKVLALVKEQAGISVDLEIPSLYL